MSKLFLQVYRQQKWKFRKRNGYIFWRKFDIIRKYEKSGWKTNRKGKYVSRDDNKINVYNVAEFPEFSPISYFVL